MSLGILIGLITVIFSKEAIRYEYKTLDFDLKNLKVKTWFIDLILGLLYIVLGVVLMIFSDESAEVVRILLGIILILSALFNLFDFIDSIIRSKRDERVIKTIKKHIDEADHIDIDFTK